MSCLISFGSFTLLASNDYLINSVIHSSISLFNHSLFIEFKGSSALNQDMMSEVQKLSEEKNTIVTEARENLEVCVILAKDTLTYLPSDQHVRTAIEMSMRIVIKTT